MTLGLGGVAAFVAEEDRDDAGAGRQALINAGRQRPDAVGQFQPGVCGDRLAIPGLMTGSGQFEGDGMGMAGEALPLFRAWGGRGRFGVGQRRNRCE